MNLQRVLLILAILFFGIGSWQTWGYYDGMQIEPVLVSEIKELTPTPTMLPTPTFIVSSETGWPLDLEIEVPTPTATPDPLVDGYLLNQLVDLGEGGAIQLVIDIPGDEVLPSVWSLPIAFEKKADTDKLFDPANGTTLVYKSGGYGYGEVPIWLAHSGDEDGKPLFGANLEFYLKVKEVGKTKYTEEESKQLLQGLVGSPAWICQDTSGDIGPLQGYSVETAECLGNKVNLKINGAVMISGEEVFEYEEHTLDLHHWLLKHYPEAGFQTIRSTTGFLFVICLPRLENQSLVFGLPRAEHNRVILAFEVIP